jgi:hypothetical protein
MGWVVSAPAALLPPGKEPPVPIGQEAGWAPEPVWTQSLEEKSSYLCRGSNLDGPVVQSVAIHYTDWATPAPNCHSAHTILYIDYPEIEPGLCREKLTSYPLSLTQSLGNEIKFEI